jgi:uracil-DNA glycosylase
MSVKRIRKKKSTGVGKRENVMLSANNYRHESWSDRFPKGRVDVRQLVTNSYWDRLFGEPKWQARLKRVNRGLNKRLAAGDTIYPLPAHVFAGLNAISPESASTMIIGQDPYHKDHWVKPQEAKKKGVLVPQAMGYSFSVPKGVSIPSSLSNIYNNLEKYGHFTSRPTHGELTFWTMQGCGLLNTALTVCKNEPNSHADIWPTFTEPLLRHISEEMKPGVFVFWGRPALLMSKKFDLDRHKTIVSSHPSGLSFHSTLKSPFHKEVVYGAFRDTDHFGEINKALEELGRDPIVWQLPA